MIKKKKTRSGKLGFWVLGTFFVPPVLFAITSFDKQKVNIVDAPKIYYSEPQSSSEINSVNAKIDAEVSRAKKPSVRPSLKWKLGKNMKKGTDFIIVPHDQDLVSKVVKVGSIGGPGAIRLRNRLNVVLVTVEVSSLVPGTKKATYRTTLEIRNYVGLRSYKFFKRIAKHLPKALPNLSSSEKLPNEILPTAVLKVIEDTINTNKLPNAVVKSINSNRTGRQTRSLSPRTIARIKKQAIEKFTANGVIELVPNSQAGKLEVVVKFGKEFRYTISGFKTDIALQNAIQALEPDALNGLQDATKLASEVTPEEAIKVIKSLERISNLDQPLQNLLTTEKILLVANNNAKTLKVTIKSFGQAKEFTISGFSSLQERLTTRIQNLSADALTNLANNKKLASAISKLEVLAAIKMLASIKTLPVNIKALLTKASIKLVSDDNAGTLSITINDHGAPKTFTKIVGFKKVTPATSESTGLSTSGIVGISFGSTAGAAILGSLGYLLIKKRRSS